MNRVATPKVQILTKLCKRCGICVELCPKEVFGTDDIGTPEVVRPDECTQCLSCELHCPEYAIEVVRPEE
ncbi:MAG: 4Fe-4S binding protein [Thermodesulfobacteriota bacterium]